MGKNIENKLNPIVTKYAEAILAGMPPKQALRQRASIMQMCELLFVEATLEAGSNQLKNVEGLLLYFKNKEDGTQAKSLSEGSYPLAGCT
jgi:hypothetical protein